MSRHILQLFNPLSVWSTTQAKVRNNGIAPHTEAGATFETLLAIFLAHALIIKDERWDSLKYKTTSTNPSSTLPTPNS